MAAAARLESLCLALHPQLAAQHRLSSAPPAAPTTRPAHPAAVVCSAAPLATQPDRVFLVVLLQHQAHPQANPVVFLAEVKLARRQHRRLLAVEALEDLERRRAMHPSQPEGCLAVVELPLVVLPPLLLPRLDSVQLLAQHHQPHLQQTRHLFSLPLLQPALLQVVACSVNLPNLAVELNLALLCSASRVARLLEPDRLCSAAQNLPLPLLPLLVCSA